MVFQVIEQTQFCDRYTDTGGVGGGDNMSPYPKGVGGDIITLKELTLRPYFSLTASSYQAHELCKI